MSKSASSIASLIVFVLVSSFTHAADDPNVEIQKLKAQVQALEQRVAALEEFLATQMKQQQTSGAQQKLRQMFNARMQKDLDKYSREQLREIEQLYQVANQNWKTQEAQDSLKKLIEQYGDANRTGCAVLYLGQMSEGQQREEYLKRAYEKHGDCMYGDGVQVGAYARYLLANEYARQGKRADAQRLFDEIKKNYPDAVDHQGKPLMR